MSVEATVIVLFSIATAVAIGARRLRIPYTAALVVVGLGLSALHVVEPPHLTREVLFAFILPGLLFEAAFNLEITELRRSWWGITALAVPGVVVAIAFTAWITTTTITTQAPNPSVAGQPVKVSFTVATVAPGSGTPTGNVNDSDGVGDTCTGTVASGSCTLAFATAGTKTVTASYAGDGNFNSSASAGVAQNVIDFSISAKPTSASLKAGQKTTYTITLTPL